MQNINTSHTSKYIDLLKKMLTDYGNINGFEYYTFDKVDPNWKTRVLFILDKLLRRRNFVLTKRKYIEQDKRFNGYDWPANALTMIGINRLTNIENCIHVIHNDKIEGDFIEAGVWRGDSTIFMAAMLKELQITDKKVWVADSFQGLPKPDSKKYKADKGNTLHNKRILTISLEEVKNNFKKFDLLDDQVEFLPGWFKDTLPTPKIKKLSLIRLDADMYASTIQSLEHLYPKLSVGGYIIIDDYHAFQNCKRAVDEYRKQHNINEEIIIIDKEAVFWRKGA